MINMKNISKMYGDCKVLNGITLTIDQPGLYCLLGRNGAGKTTLLKSIAGYQNVSSGDIEINGKPITTAAMETGVSYIENFARHYNLPIQKLLKMASDLNSSFDYAFATEMMMRFELDGKKKFNKLSLGMKTMISTIICLASHKDVVLLDEPVLGFDAIMRVEFYEMLAQSYKKHPRIIIVSTHIIEEIAKTIDKLIIIDKGSILFFDTLQAVETRAYQIHGLKQDVIAATKQKQVFAQEQTDEFITRYIFDIPPEASNAIQIDHLSLQAFFIQMVSHKGGIIQ